MKKTISTTKKYITYEEPYTGQTGRKNMKITGRAVTQKEHDRLMSFAGVSEADEIAIGYMKMKDGRYYPVARFFKEDKFLFYITM